MAALLYAEVYLICIMVVGLVLFWSRRSGSESMPDRWLTYTLVAFLVNFASNLLFTVFNGIYVIDGLAEPLSYFFKSCYHISLCTGVFMWCGYAAAESGVSLLGHRTLSRLMLVGLLALIAIVFANTWTHHLFYLDENLAYRRSFMFHTELLALIAISTIFSYQLLRQAHHESDPAIRGHLRLTALFPLCLVAAWIFSFIGESVPVICVAIMLMLLCIYMGTTNQQIATDKLTRVNNRQNLIGYLDYKLNNHKDNLYLLMMDIDFFKSINDTYGHLEGDSALIRVAQVLKDACRPFRKRPFIARYGGDEFIIVVEATPDEVAELQRVIESTFASISANDIAYSLHLSIGVAQWEEGMKRDDLIAAADKKLYEIKRAR